METATHFMTADLGLVQPRDHVREELSRRCLNCTCFLLFLPLSLPPGLDTQRLRNDEHCGKSLHGALNAYWR